jgi:DNA primase large subunit
MKLKKMIRNNFFGGKAHAKPSLMLIKLRAARESREAILHNFFFRSLTHFRLRLHVEEGKRIPKLFDSLLIARSILKNSFELAIVELRDARREVFTIFKCFHGIDEEDCELLEGVGRKLLDQFDDVDEQDLFIG